MIKHKILHIPTGEIGYLLVCKPFDLQEIDKICMTTMCPAAYISDCDRCPWNKDRDGVSISEYTLID